MGHIPGLPDGMIPNVEIIDEKTIDKNEHLFYC